MEGSATKDKERRNADGLGSSACQARAIGELDDFLDQAGIGPT